MAGGEGRLGAFGGNGECQTEKLPQGEQSRVTIHRLVEAFDRERKGMALVQADLFDSRPVVALSALAALARMRSPDGFALVCKLFAHEDEEVRRAAVETAAAIGHPDTLRILLDLYNVTQDEALRSTILESLWKAAPGDARVRDLLAGSARSTLLPPAVRASAAALLLVDGAGGPPEGLLSETEGEYVDQVFARAEADAALASRLVEHGIKAYKTLPPPNRGRLVSIAGIHAVPAAGSLLHEALRDPDAEVRLAAYRAIRQTDDPARLAPIARMLWEGVESDPAIEGEAWIAIERMESHSRGASPRLAFTIRGGALASIRALFEDLARSGRPAEEAGPSSDSAKSREYLEYYGDEALKKALVDYLKGSRERSETEMLATLKASAVRLEACHVNGYKALVGIIRNPQRHVTGLVMRDLALARLEKRVFLYRLMRRLRLSRLYRPASPRDEAECYADIFEWSQAAGFYRLAEAALAAIAPVDRGLASEIAARCLAPPIRVKMLAIASIRLLRDLDWKLVAPAIIKLLGAVADAHVLLNLMDALASLDVALEDSFVELLLKGLRLSTDPEVAARIAEVIGARAGAATFEPLRLLFPECDEAKKGLCLSIFNRMVTRGSIGNRDALVEMLYKTLRGGASGLQARAACLLWRLGDEYSLKVIRDLLTKGGAEVQAQVLQGLKGSVGPTIVPVLFPLLGTGASSVQLGLRETLLSAESDAARDAIVGLLLPGGEEEAGQTGGQTEVSLDHLSEKRSYQFDREHVQNLAVFFTDIQGYSTKAERLSGMELAEFIQDYEGVLLPVVTSHRGELIKKMGDGHLFVFESPLDAALAAVRLQKALTRFNSYREERKRIDVRIGIHYGEALRREGDVLGNDVNIAARLQAAARAGSALVSDVVQDKVRDYINSKAIGAIRIKGISEPVSAYEPFEIAVDLPKELDPLKAGPKMKAAAAPAAASAAPAPPAPGARPASPELAAYLQETFSALYASCKKVELGEIDAAEIRKLLVERWKGVKSRVAPSRAATRPAPPPT